MDRETKRQIRNAYVVLLAGSLFFSLFYGLKFAFFFAYFLILSIPVWVLIIDEKQEGASLTSLMVAVMLTLGIFPTLVYFLGIIPLKHGQTIPLSNSVFIITFIWMFLGFLVIGARFGWWKNVGPGSDSDTHIQ